MVLVMAVPADGAITFINMLYFFPSRASVRVKPVIAAFAVEYWTNMRDLLCRVENHTTDICLAEIAICINRQSTAALQTEATGMYTHRFQLENTLLQCARISAAEISARQLSRTGL